MLRAGVIEGSWENALRHIERAKENGATKWWIENSCCWARWEKQKVESLAEGKCWVY